MNANEIQNLRELYERTYSQRCTLTSAEIWGFRYEIRGTMSSARDEDYEIVLNMNSYQRTLERSKRLTDATG